MSIDDSHLLDFMQDVRGSLGEIKANQKNTHGYVENVAYKLNRHVDDPEAHGGKSRNQVWMTIGGVIAAAGVLVGIAQAFK